MTTIDWPSINSLLQLQCAHVTETLSTRLEDRQGHVLHLSAPSTHNIPTLFADIGSSVVITWLTSRGTGEITANVVATERKPLPLWIVRANGEPILHQRRNFARLSVSLPVALTDAAGKTTVTTTEDISEGGMNCLVPSDDSLLTGSPVEIELTIDDHALEANAIVVRTRVVSNMQADVSLRFEGIHQRDQDRIRQFIFTEQLRTRALDRSR